jgi:hypothetical protein
MAFAHGLFGETRVFARPERLGRLIRGCLALERSGVGWCRSPADRCAMDGLADGATLDRRRSRRYLRLWFAWVMREPHLGWAALTIVVVLAVAWL